MPGLRQQYEKDMRAWDDCAETYERQIVGGHPDILAFEAFEEDLLDRVIGHLAGHQRRRIKLMDIGCGSGRLHVRYGLKTHRTAGAATPRSLSSLSGNTSNLAFDPEIAGALCEVWGVDFSRRMIELARDKLASIGLGGEGGLPLRLEQGSAFELGEEPGDTLPLAICLVNSIGVMQGVEGGGALFASMRRVVEAAGGVAIISCYQREFIESYGLGQYESTLDVSGQPRWLLPETYTGPDYRQLPKTYKLAHSEDDTLAVDVIDTSGTVVVRDHVLRRDPHRVRELLRTGDIITHTDYRSHWYLYDELEALIGEHWGDRGVYHLKTGDLDRLRAEPAQLAILDAGDNLRLLLDRWMAT
jgi:SAM-dependent methyltransferase